MNDLLSLIVYLLLAGVLVYIVFWILGMLPIPPQAKNVITMVMALIVLLWLVTRFLPGALAFP